MALRSGNHPKGSLFLSEDRLNQKITGKPRARDIFWKPLASGCTHLARRHQHTDFQKDVQKHLKERRSDLESNFI